MLQAIQSSFMQALGYAIINSMWQFALLWLIYVSLHTIFTLTSVQKYAAGLLVQAAGFIWFAITCFFYVQRFTQLEEIYFLQQKKLSFAFVKNHSSIASQKWLTDVLDAENIFPCLSAAYLFILLLLCIKWMRIYNSTQIIKTKRVQKTEEAWQLFVKELSARLGIKRHVKIYLSETVKVPLTIGFLKPLILLPVASLNHLTTYQTEAVILHELAHIKRFDYLFNFFLAFIDMAFFFNPFALFINKQIKHERENCCDDMVLHYKYNAACYANALLKIAVCQSSASLLALQAADNKQVLLSRIKRMIEKREKTFFNYKYHFIALFVVLFVVGSLALLSFWHEVNRTNATAPLPKQVMARPMFEVADNPLYNPNFIIAPEKKGILTNTKQLQKTQKKKNTFLQKKDFNTSVYKNNNTGILNEIAQIKENHELLKDEIKRAAEQAKIFMEKPAADFAEARTLLSPANEPADAKKQPEEITIHLFEKNYALDKQAVTALLKNTLRQFEAMKVQLNTAKQKLAAFEKRNLLKANQMQINSQQTDNYNADALQLLNNQIQKQTEQVAEQRKKVSGLQEEGYNNYTVPDIMLSFQRQEKSQHFSFELSEMPKIQTELLNILKVKVKKTNKIITRKKNQNFTIENNPFFNWDNSARENLLENDRKIIRI